MTLNHFARYAQAILLATVVAALVAPAVALGGSNSGKPAPDVFERYAAAHPFGHGAGLSAEAPDWFERYAASHAPSVALDGRSSDTLDAVQAARTQTLDGRAPDTLDAVANTTLQVADGRSADTLDAASAPQPIEIVEPGSFDWGDAGIGAVAAAMLMAVIASGLLLLGRVHRRQRVQAT